MTRVPELATNETYHIYNSGVDGRKVFLSESDFLLFYEYLYLFNDMNYTHHKWGKIARMSEIQTMRATGYDVRDPLVDIIAFNLMDTHFHLMLTQRYDDGISQFLHILQKSYARVTNEKYGRRGSLFNRPFQSSHINNAAYFEFLPIYIHGNGMDCFGLPWREGLVQDWDEALRLMERRKYSSHHLAMGEPQELPVVTSTYLEDTYKDKEDYIKHLKEWSTRHGDQLREYEAQFSNDVTMNPYKR